MKYRKFEAVNILASSFLYGNSVYIQNFMSGKQENSNNGPRCIEGRLKVLTYD